LTDVLRIKRRALGGAAGAPASLAVGELAYNEQDSGLYIGRSNGTVVQVNSASTGNVSNSGTPANGQWAQWTDATHITGVATASAPFVQKAGDVMTGALWVSSSWPVYYINKANSGEAARIISMMSSSARWVVSLGNADAETGSNAGSNFEIISYGDSGSALNTNLNINRATGTTTINGVNSDPLYIQSGGHARAIMVPNNAGSNKWSMGALSNGTFSIADETAGVARMVIDGSGYTTLSNGVTINNWGIRYINLATNWIAFSWGYPVPGLLGCYIDGGSTSYALANGSDERLKQDIAPSTLDYLATIAQLEVCEFRWKEHTEPGKPKAVPKAEDTLVRAGLIAQKTFEVAWWLARKPAPEKEAGKINIWDIDQNNLIATLVGAVQQLTARVEDLEAKLAD
jgi:hypothetical protein